MKTFSAASEFMRMRSPSSAPPERRRVGSIATTAIWRSGKWRTKRCSSSSFRLDLPAPPVPVRPMTGAPMLRLGDRAANRVCAGRRSPALPRAPRSRARATHDRAHCSGPNAYGGRLRAARTREHVVDHAVEADATPVLGRVDPLDAVPLERFDLVRRNRAAAADHDANVARRPSRAACRPCRRSIRCVRPGTTTPRWRRRPPGSRRARCPRRCGCARDAPPRRRATAAAGGSC